MINLIKKIKYFFQFTIILSLFFLFKLLGLSNSRFIASKIFILFGPFFRSNIITKSNISKAFPNKDENFKNKIIHEMWLTYGKILSEYNFIKDFREGIFAEKIEVKGQSELDKIKTTNVNILLNRVFISTFSSPS